MPRGDGTVARKIAEDVATHPQVGMLKRWYLKGGGSETDFVTDLEGAVDVTIEKYVADITRTA